MVSRGTVDIVVPTNRVSRFLPAALASVRGQRYPRWRLLIVDDGSGAPDELERLAAELPSARVIHQQHAGVSAARNAAIRAGTGEFVAFLDDDDLWPSERLGELVETLQAHPDAAGAFGNGRYIDADGNVFGQWTTKPASRDEFLSRATPIPRIVTMLVRRTALDRVGVFDERLAFSEDDELILRLLRDAPLVSSMTVVVDYRRHDHNVTLADWRTRHRSARAAILANIVAAKQLGHHDQVALLRRYLRRQDAWTAEGSAGRMIGDLKSRRFRAAALDMRDSVRMAPLGFVRGALQTAGSRIRSRMCRQSN
jgi:glycosyltransferase involved in cell wall biosynthesis